MRFFVIMILVTLCAKNAEATVCKQIKDGIKRYELVFFGEAISSRKTVAAERVKTPLYVTPSDVTRFKVLEVYKGPISEFFEVYHSNSPSYGRSGNKLEPVYIPGSRISYDIGTQYYMFLNRGGESGQYVSSFCDPRVRDLQDKLPLEKFKALSRMYEMMLSPDYKLGNNQATNWHRAAVYMDQGAFYEEYNDFDRALESYVSGINGYTRGDDRTLSQIIAPNSKVSKELKIGIARIFYKKGEYSKALGIFDQIITAYEKQMSRSPAFNDAKKYRAMTLEAMEQQK